MVKNKKVKEFLEECEGRDEPIGDLAKDYFRCESNVIAEGFWDLESDLGIINYLNSATCLKHPDVRDAFGDFLSIFKDRVNKTEVDLLKRIEEIEKQIEEDADE